jgi:sulfur-oxidizing protein SoxZ
VAGSSIKMRTQIRAGVCTVRALIRHPMEVGRRDSTTGERSKAHFITRVTCLHQDREVLNAHWGGGIAKNPYLSFMFDGASGGDSLSLSWEDNWGETDTLAIVL